MGSARGLLKLSKEGDRMLSEIDKRPYAHECGKTNYIFCPACVYAEGRKAERERCARIADDEAIEHMDGDESYMCGAVEEIAKRIRGGQDAK